MEPDRAHALAEDITAGVDRLNPAWREFIRFCKDLRHGEIERLSIQDGLPVLAEVTRRKIKFNGRA
jgi:hypothetical protein